MNNNTSATTDGIDSFDILIFSIGKTKFAFDMAQVGNLSEKPKKPAMGVTLASFHEKIGFKGEKFKYKAEKVVSFLDGKNDKAIIINSPEDIVALSLKNIHPMPYLINFSSRKKAIWGATFIDGEIVLLVDLQKLWDTD